MALAALFGSPLPSLAGIISGNSGTAYVSDYNAIHWIRLGKGLSGSLHNIYLHVADNKSATYFTNLFIVGLDTDSSTPLISGPHVKQYYAPMDGAGCGGYSYWIPQTGDSTSPKARQIVFPFTYTWNNLNSTCGSYPTLNEDYWYYVYVSSSNDKDGSPTAGTFALLGTNVTLTDNFGTPLECFSGAITASLCSNIGTPGYYLADTTLVSGDTGYLAPSSASSQFSLSGAGTFCGTLASSSFAFGIPYGLCYIGGYLFIPSQSSIDTFNANLSLVKTKVPFSYAYGIADLWTAASSSQTFPKIGMELDIFGSSGSLDIISSASFYRWIDASTWSTIRGVSTAALYVAFGFFLWNMRKRLFA